MIDAVCPDYLTSKVSSILQEHLFNTEMAIEKWYTKVRAGEELTNTVSSAQIHPALQNIISGKWAVKNCGIDLPVWFGDLNSEKRVMIVALDPKRNQTTSEITLGSVFSLHTSEGRNTRRNNYWNFIRPLTEQGFVYVTDIFKFYFETKHTATGSFVLSNKNKDHIRPDSDCGKLYKQILQAEIDLVRPQRIITLGNEAASAVKKIRNIDTADLTYVDGTSEYIFLPHISNTVTQSIKTIGNLFLGTGIIKNDEHLVSIGKDILQRRNLLK